MTPSKHTAIGIAAVAALLVSLQIVAGEAERLTIVADGQSDYSIAVPDDADQPRLGKAADLLQSVVAEATGVKLPVLKESALGDGGPTICLGKSQAARKAELPVDKVEGWSYLNRTVGRDLFLVGQDGAAWAQECVEIMIDPIGERQKHCQFIINPAPESTYDARYAYIEDPLHPLYGKRDSTWNGEWQYVAVVDKEQNRWTVEIRIPFATLEVQPPGPGTTWTMSLGRAEYPNGYKGGPVYSLWSPNLETRSFHDRSTFGDVTFR